MRIQMLFGSSIIAAAALVGCGGDDGHVTVPDAKKADAAPDAPHMCLTMGSFGTLSIGTMAMPYAGTGTDAGQWFFTDMDTQKVYFSVGGRLNMDAAPDILIFALDVPGAGSFTTGAPYAFQTDPTAADQANQAILYADVNGNMATQVLWPQPGSPNPALTFSMVGQTAGSKIFGTVNGITFKEVDDMGALVTGGCTTTMGGFNFFLSQTQNSPRLAPPSDPTGSTGEPGGYANPIPVHGKAQAFEYALKQILAQQ